MTTGLDGRFWSQHFLRVFTPQINAFCDAFVQRVLPVFAQIEEEADAAAQAEYERLGRLPSDGGWDMADAAEKAIDVGMAHYETLSAVRQTLLNLAVAALCHMVEQQIMLFHRKQVLHPREEDEPKLINHGRWKTRMRDAGVDVTTLPSWAELEELRHIANSVKHAEGKAAAKLREIRPELLIHPSLREETSVWDLATHPLYLPLAGEDLYLSIDDLEQYRSIVVSFWRELGDAITAV